MPDATWALSVVVPSVNGLDDLRGCLKALDAQRADVALDVLVVDRLGEPLRDAVRAEFPTVRILPAPVGTTIPILRAVGIRESRAAAVAVIEDHVLVRPGWARQLLAALADGADVVGGSVENAATETYVDWSAFLCEYSGCLPPLPAGPTDWLPGNNTVYRRAVLEQFQSEVEAGRWENHLHDAIRRAGGTLVCRPEIVVGHKMHYTVALYTGQRYLYARSFAGMRVAGAAWPRRLVYGLAAAMLLPPLTYVRTVARVWPKAGYRGHLVRSLPLLAVFVTAWGLGETVGAWFGPGDALERVR